MYQTVLAVEFVWISMYANVIRDGLEAIVLNTLANNWIIALVSWKIFFGNFIHSLRIKLYSDLRRAQRFR